MGKFPISTTSRPPKLSRPVSASKLPRFESCCSQDAAAQQGLSLWLARISDVNLLRLNRGRPQLQVIPTVFQNLCIISCAAKPLCSPLHSVVEAGLAERLAFSWLSFLQSVAGGPFRSRKAGLETRPRLRGPVACWSQLGSHLCQCSLPGLAGEEQVRSRVATCDL